MANRKMKSFRLARPTCPHCDSERTRMDWTAFENLFRVPFAIVSGLAIYPANGIRMCCAHCGWRFLASRNGQSAAKI